MNTSQWTLYVDCKEPEAENLCEDLRSYSVTASVGNHEEWFAPAIIDHCKTHNLSVGDYWAARDGKVWAIIERKTLADMDSSIEDGRYKSQAHRMIKTEVPFLFYMIVGSLDSLDGPTHQRISSSLMHLQMQNALKVCYVPRKGYVVPFLVKFFQYLVSNPTPDNITAPMFEQAQTLGTKKKMDTHNAVFTAQLAIIQGMSEDKAKAVSNHYKDFPTLIKAYEACRDDLQKANLLKDIFVKKTKLGPVLSERIYYCVMGLNQPKQTKKRKSSSSSLEDPPQKLHNKTP